MFEIYFEATYRTLVYSLGLNNMIKYLFDPNWAQTAKIYL